MRIGSNKADSIKTFVVSLPQAVVTPPITPPKATGPESSQTTVIPPSRAYFLSLSASKVSPDFARRTCTLPFSLSASKTCKGRARSTVIKLVISTNAEMGRKPIARSRCCSHNGLSPLTTPLILRPTKKEHASADFSSKFK